MANTTNPKQAAAIAVKQSDTVDLVAARVRKFQESGELNFPASYSPENAMKAAWLTLQEVKDRNSNAALAVCTKSSVANALLNMVVQGLNPSKKQCYFIVYGDQLTCQRSYFGSMHIAKAVDPHIVDIVAYVVYSDELDSFESKIIDGYEVVTGHARNPFRKPGSAAIIGAYATVIYDDGRQRSTIMSMEDIKRAWTMSKAFAIKDGEINPSSTHGKFTEEMAKKTVINRACKTIINASDDSSLLVKAYHATEADVAEAEEQEDIATYANKQPLTVDEGTGEVLDGGFLADDAAAPEEDLP